MLQLLNRKFQSSIIRCKCSSIAIEIELLTNTYRITTYLITFGFIGGLGYLAYNSFVPKSRKIRKPASAKPTGSTTDSIAGTGNYEEEWIPEHHLKLRSNKKKTGALSSGDELSGSEVSGTEGKRRKDRK